MKKTIKNTITFLIAIVGLFGGIIWAINTNFDYEPIILAIISFLEIVGYLTLKDEKKEDSIPTNNKNEVNILINTETKEKEKEKEKEEDVPSNDRNTIIEKKKNIISILFIDDDTNFRVVKILKDSGWKRTKSVIDIKSIDIPIVQNADILFIDINGVGKILGLEYEGLDLALMIKQKYSTKKVIIYSANKNSNSFHKAWDIIDSRLVKNALPYQFQNLVENYSIEIKK